MTNQWVDWETWLEPTDWYSGAGVGAQFELTSIMYGCRTGIRGSFVFRTPRAARPYASTELVLR